MRVYLIFLFFLWFSTDIAAQNHLSTLMTLDVKDRRLGDVLERISNIGGFYFSYRSDIVDKDSLVSISARQETVEHILNHLLRGGYEYKETSDYIIVRLAPRHLHFISEGIVDYGRHSISGYIIDSQTGQKISNASVYERNTFTSTISDQSGYFKLRLKRSVQAAALTISKEYYHDTTLLWLAPIHISGHHHKNRKHSYRSIYGGTNSDKTSFAQFFISTKQKIHRLNLGEFLGNAPVQTSLIPGVGTQGALSGQISNNLSINVLGGYTSSIRGLELGGIFNINQRNMSVVQAAGVFNLVGGKVDGLQIAGITNKVLDAVNGLQAAGIFNHDRDSVKGLQIAGLLNLVSKEVKGFQAAGIANVNKAQTKGFQMAGILNVVCEEERGIQAAGIANITKTKADGLQLAGIFNYAKHLGGVQIGLINFVDSSSGTSLGLLNFIGNGLQRPSISSNELSTLNIEFRSGRPHLYTILKVGTNILSDKKTYSFGIGIGRDFVFNKKMSLSTELLPHKVYLGSWQDLSNLYRTKTVFNYRVSGLFEVFTGPTFNLFVHSHKDSPQSYTDLLPNYSLLSRRISSRSTAWVGWDIGILFSKHHF